MPNAPSVFIPLKNAAAEANPWVWLVEIFNPTGGAIIGANGEEVVLRLNSTSEKFNWGEDDTGSPFAWYPWPIKVDPIRSNTKGSIPGMNVSFGNVNGAAAAIVEDNDFLRNHRLNLYLINFAALEDPSAFWKVTGRVVDLAMAADSVSLSLSQFDHAEFDVPTFLISRTCRFRYRDALCAFIGDPGNVDLGSCPKSLVACKLRGDWELANGLTVDHPRRFGGAFSAPTGPIG